MRKVINENGEVKNFETDNEFLEYAQAVYKENERGQPYESEIHWMPENMQQAEEYIHEYCGDLKLFEDMADFRQNPEELPIEDKNGTILDIGDFVELVDAEGLDNDDVQHDKGDKFQYMGGMDDNIGCFVHWKSGANSNFFADRTIKIL